MAPGEVKPKKGKKITVLHGSAVIQMLHVDVSLNGGTPKTPQNDHF